MIYWIDSFKQRLSVARLVADRHILEYHGRRHRIVAAICDTFPIYSQTFVYQELSQLAQNGFDLRVLYSRLDSQECLSSPFAHLWNEKRRLFPSRHVHEADFAHYRRLMPNKVEKLVMLLCEASGMGRNALLAHDNFLQSFSFTRMVEAYRPEYLHSYFFYNCSLMALVAGFLLDIPRGVSCYADHVLKDYELKVVPLHLELCDLIIATSERIRNELLEIAPRTDPNRILVKPNGIDTKCFPKLERTEPQGDDPFRLVSVCRIEPKKGLLDLVDALYLLRRRGLRVEAHVVGTVDDWSQASLDYKKRLDQRIAELDLQDVVHLEGRQNLDGVLRFLKIGHVFVAPFIETEIGDKDGIPTALLEGMATSLPVVATDAGSITEVIDDGRDGILVSMHSPEALAVAIETLLKDPGRRLQIGKEAEQKVRHRFEARVCERAFHERVHAIVKARNLRSLA